MPNHLVSKISGNGSLPINKPAMSFIAGSATSNATLRSSPRLSISNPTPPDHSGTSNNSTVIFQLTNEDELIKLSKELKYREYFKRKSSSKGFQHFFLSQELSCKDCTEVLDYPETNTFDDDNAISFDTSISRGTPPNQHKNLGKANNGHNNGTATHEHANFALKFSKDGKYLASAGDDGIIRVWEVISSTSDREEYEAYYLSRSGSLKNSGSNANFTTATNANSNGNNNERKGSRRRGSSMYSQLDTDSIDPSSAIDGSIFQNTNLHDSKSKKKDRKGKSSPFAPVFKQTPVRLFHHSDTILSLDWSRSNFLISSSQDKTIKLWNVERDDCLSTFELTSFATCVLFHPKDDRFFVSSQWDGSIKLWSILENDIAYQNNIHKRITCMDFSPDANQIYVGGDSGILFILNTKDLDVFAEYTIRRKNKTPRVTGIQVFPTDNDTKLLITSNDSRIRLVSVRDKVLDTRYKGYINEHSTIRATTSDDRTFIISGSEDGWCYLWPIDYDEINNLTPEPFNKNSSGTGKKHRFHLPGLFRDEEYLTKNNNYGSFHVHHSRCNVALFAPRSTLKLLELSNDPIFDLNSNYKRLLESNNTSTLLNNKKAEDELDDLSSAVILTTDNTGLIRVFRRDFASVPRRQILTSLKRQNLTGARSTAKSLSKVRNSSRSSSILNDSSTIHNHTRNSIIGTTVEEDDERGRESFRREIRGANMNSFTRDSTVSPMPNSYKSNNELILSSSASRNNNLLNDVSSDIGYDSNNDANSRKLDEMNLRSIDHRLRVILSTPQSTQKAIKTLSTVSDHYADTSAHLGHDISDDTGNDTAISKSSNIANLHANNNRYLEDDAKFKERKNSHQKPMTGIYASSNTTDGTKNTSFGLQNPSMLEIYEDLDEFPLAFDKEHIMQAKRNNKKKTSLDDKDGEDDEDDDFTEEIRTVNTHDSGKTEIQCGNCGGSKFTAKNISDLSPNSILFYCDTCGHKVDIY